MCSITFDFTGYQITGNDTPCTTIYQHDVQHLMTGKHFYFALTDLTAQCGICAQ